MSNTKTVITDFEQITEILHSYFHGLYQGDVPKLTSIFHEDAWLKSPGSRRSLAQWLEDVSKRTPPVLLKQSFDFKILAIDLEQDQAMAKIHCPLFNFDYIDFLGLLKEDGQWRIVTKMYTNIRKRE